MLVSVICADEKLPGAKSKFGDKLQDTLDNVPKNDIVLLLGRLLADIHARVGMLKFIVVYANKQSAFLLSTRGAPTYRLICTKVRISATKAGELATKALILAKEVGNQATKAENQSQHLRPVAHAGPFQYQPLLLP